MGPTTASGMSRTTPFETRRTRVCGRDRAEIGRSAFVPTIKAGVAVLLVLPGHPETRGRRCRHPRPLEEYLRQHGSQWSALRGQAARTIFRNNDELCSPSV